MRAAIVFYASTAGYVAVGGVAATAIIRLVDKERSKTLLYDAVDITVTSVLWPIVLPIQMAMLADNLITGSKWKLTASRVREEVIDHKYVGIHTQKFSLETDLREKQ